MFVTNHVLAGALLGLAAPRRPALVAAVAIASHFAMDAVPHWGLGVARVGMPRRFLRVAVPDGLLGLGALALVAAAAPVGARPAVVAGMLGAALPDVDKPAALVGLDPVPPPIQRLHAAIQRESPGHLRRELAVGAALAAAVAARLAAADRVRS